MFFIKFFKKIFFIPVTVKIEKRSIRQKSFKSKELFKVCRAFYNKRNKFRSATGCYDIALGDFL